MDRLVDHLFVFEGAGEVRDFPGNYSQYRIWLKEQEESAVTDRAQTTEKNDSIVAVAGIKQTSPEEKRKLSYKEKRELELLQTDITALEKEKTLVNEKLSSGDIPFDELQKLSVRIGEINALMDEKELRWLELSEGE